MGFIERFLGRGDEKGAPKANPAVERALNLHVLFAAPPKWNETALTTALRSYHPSLSAATFEIDPQTAAQGTPIGLAGWQKHVVRVVGFDAPMPRKVVDPCIQAAHYPKDLKERARAHQAHALLSYAGNESSALEQYVALAVVAGALSQIGAIVVGNESARTSFPAEALRPRREIKDMLEVLRHMPLLYLYSGFAKYGMDGIPGVWMRTHGNHLLGIPDLAAHAQGHHEASRIHGIFSNLMEYLLTSKARMDAGHTAQISENEFIKLRAPRKDEYFLDSPTELLVVEFITNDQINRPKGM